MPKKFFKEKSQPSKMNSSYLNILSSIREKDEEEILEDDNDFSKEFQENHYIITILNCLHKAKWFENKQQEQYCILRLRKHPNLNWLMTAIQCLTNEPTLAKELRQSYLNTTIFSEDPIKTASIIINLNRPTSTESTTPPEAAADTFSNCCFIA